MAIINLLPSSLRGREKPKGEKIKIPKITPLIFNIAIIVSLSSVGLWVSLSMQVKSKEKILTSLTQRLNLLNTDYQKIDELTKRKSELSNRLSFYQNIFGKNIVWSEKLRFINENLPDQIWLTNLYTETKPTKMLVIKSSSTSLIETEIIDSISQFAENLSKDKDFAEVKLGALVAEKRGKLNIMNFSINCKLK